jgi:hypothetical protein
MLPCVNQAARTCTQSGATAPGTLSQKGTYGLMSSTGEPSTMSAPPSTSLLPLTSMMRAMDSPTGAGLWGLRVASTPMVPPSRRGTLIFDLTGALLPG